MNLSNQYFSKYKLTAGIALSVLFLASCGSKKSTPTNSKTPETKTTTIDTAGDKIVINNGDKKEIEVTVDNKEDLNYIISLKNADKEAHKITKIESLSDDIQIIESAENTCINKELASNGVCEITFKPVKDKFKEGIKQIKVTFLNLKTQKEETTTLNVNVKAAENPNKILVEVSNAKLILGKDTSSKITLKNISKENLEINATLVGEKSPLTLEGLENCKTLAAGTSCELTVKLTTKPEATKFAHGSSELKVEYQNSAKEIKSVSQTIEFEYSLVSIFENSPWIIESDKPETKIKTFKIKNNSSETITLKDSIYLLPSANQNYFRTPKNSEETSKNLCAFPKHELKAGETCDVSIKFDGNPDMKSFAIEKLNFNIKTSTGEEISAFDTFKFINLGDKVLNLYGYNVTNPTLYVKGKCEIIERHKIENNSTQMIPITAALSFFDNKDKEAILVDFNKVKNDLELNKKVTFYNTKEAPEKAVEVLTEESATRLVPFTHENSNIVCKDQKSLTGSMLISTSSQKTQLHLAAGMKYLDNSGTVKNLGFSKVKFPLVIEKAFGANYVNTYSASSDNFKDGRIESKVYSIDNLDLLNKVKSKRTINEFKLQYRSSGDTNDGDLNILKNSFSAIIPDNIESIDLVEGNEGSLFNVQKTENDIQFVKVLTPAFLKNMKSDTVNVQMLNKELKANINVTKDMFRTENSYVVIVSYFSAKNAELPVFLISTKDDKNKNDTDKVITTR